MVDEQWPWPCVGAQPFLQFACLKSGLFLGMRREREMMRSGKESGINEKTEFSDNHAG